MDADGDAIMTEDASSSRKRKERPWEREEVLRPVRAIRPIQRRRLESLGFRLFIQPLSLRQLNDYKRPIGTLDPERGRGMNCTQASLKLLGLITEYTANRNTARINALIEESGYGLTPQDIIGSLRMDLAVEYHRDVRILLQKTTLEALVNSLGPGQATTLVYGQPNSVVPEEAGKEKRHFVVLRKGEDGQAEMIDPQRGVEHIGKSHGFYPQEVASLGMIVRENYIRVIGMDNVKAAMYIQSVRFRYFENPDVLGSATNKGYAIYRFPELFIGTVTHEVLSEITSEDVIGGRKSKTASSRRGLPSSPRRTVRRSASSKLRGRSHRTRASRT